MTMADLLTQAAQLGGDGEGDPLRKKVVEISLAPDVLEEFAKKRAKYVIKKKRDPEEELRKL